MKPIRTYVLIADGPRPSACVGRPGKALGRGAGFRACAGYQADHELSAERPGRVHESATVVRHAIERDDLHRREKERFAQSLAGDLDRRLANNEFDRLVIAAAPETLGVIRAALSEKVKAVLLGEVAKDLTKLPNPQVRTYLGDELPI